MGKKVSVLLLLATLRIYAAFELQCFNPLWIARANIQAQYPGGINPAALRTSRGWAFSLNYANLYGIKELTAWQGQATWQFHPKHHLSADYSLLGNAIYQERTIGLSYGWQFNPMLAIGSRLALYDLYVADYSFAPTLGIGLGALFRVDSALSIGMLLNNCNQPRLHHQADEIPQTFTCGLRWRIVRRLELGAELYKDLSFPLTEKVGLDFGLLPGWHLLAGVQLNPDRLTLGTIITIRHFSFAVAWQHHPTLPYTVYLGCSWQSW